MSHKPWELVLAPLGEACWDEATELAAMIADECFPTVLDERWARQTAAEIVVALAHDEDWRRCVEAVLAKALDNGSRGEGT